MPGQAIAVSPTIAKCDMCGGQLIVGSVYSMSYLSPPKHYITAICRSGERLHGTKSVSVTASQFKKLSDFL